jgi:hypothetical protein
MTPAEAQATDTARSLEALGLEDLRAEWRRRYGVPPTLRSPVLLRHLLAWRIQADAMGGLDPGLLRQLRRVADSRTSRGPALEAGSRLAREWQGRLHEVEIREQGVFYEGRRYKSLSAVARAITGSRWNGPRFFGLRSAEA